MADSITSTLNNAISSYEAASGLNPSGAPHGTQKTAAGEAAAFATQISMVAKTDHQPGDPSSFPVDAATKMEGGKATTNGKYGTIAMDPSGKWTYTVNNNNIQWLGEEERRVETFNIQIENNRGGKVDRTVRVAIIGRNDVPTITPREPGYRAMVIEEARAQAKSKLNIHDADHDESFFRSKIERDE